MFLKYKFMGLKVPIESVKGEFDYKLIEDSLNVKDN